MDQYQDRTGTTSHHKGRKKSTKEESNETRLHVLFKLETIIRKRPSPIHPHVGQLSTSCIGERSDPLYDEYCYNMCHLQNT